MKLAIIGSRNFPLEQKEFVLEKVKQLHQQTPITCIVSGGAKGADTLAEQVAAELGLLTLIFKPDWAQYHKGAGQVRNREIAEAADRCFAFVNKPLEESKGTHHCVKEFRKRLKPAAVFQV